MRTFDPKLLKVSGATADMLTPVDFQGRVDELTLEKWIVERPELVGENLLVLGRQLAEFAEDQDRLDVLAIDTDGELVLIELKVTGTFRVTDLQALAYAGAYADMKPAHLAQTLQRTLQKAAESTGGSQNGEPKVVTIEEVRSRIVDFLGFDDFGEWEPSKHVRIKLVAPAFPKRVLKTVKWLGDVYGMKVEAIVVRLFEDGENSYRLAFERLLPLPGEDEFDLTVRRQEDKKRSDNTSRRQSVLPLLLKEGLVNDGDRLWVAKTGLPADKRGLYDPDSPLFQVTVREQQGASPKVVWRASADHEPQLLAPSAVWYAIYQTLLPDLYYEPFSTAVATTFRTAPDGQTLKEIAIEQGLWESDS